MLFNLGYGLPAAVYAIYATSIMLPSVQAAPQLIGGGGSVLNVDLGARVLVGDTSCPAVDANGGLTGRVFAAVSLAERATVSALTVNLAQVTANVQTCICVRAGVAVGNIVPSTSLNAEAASDIRLAAQANVALNNLLTTTGNVLNVNLSPTAAVECGSCLPNQYPSCASGSCTCINCPTGQFYSASRGQCVVSASPLARARVKARSEALIAEEDNKCSASGSKSGKCKRNMNVLQMRQATREAVVERYNRTLTNTARKPVRYQRLELVSQ